MEMNAIPTRRTSRSDAANFAARPSLLARDAATRVLRVGLNENARMIALSRLIRACLNFSGESSERKPLGIDERTAASLRTDNHRHEYLRAGGLLS
jgi:hypothetical protein